MKLWSVKEPRILPCRSYQRWKVPNILNGNLFTSCRLRPAHNQISWSIIQPKRFVVHTMNLAKLNHLVANNRLKLFIVHPIGFLNLGANFISNAYHAGIRFEHPTQL